MKAIALIIALMMVSLGLTGVLWPEGLMQLASNSFTGTGMHVVAAVRVVLGALLIVAASATRTPKTIRVIGLIILLVGIAGAFVPAERALAMKDWLVNRGPDTLRIAACLPLVVGIFVGLSALTRERKP